MRDKLLLAFFGAMVLAANAFTFPTSSDRRTIPSVWNDPRVLRCEGMAVGAVRSGLHQESPSQTCHPDSTADSHGPSHIFFGCNRLQVLRINTARGSTKMVEFQSIWNLSYENLVGKSMGTHSPVSVKNAISSRYFVSSPEPTAAHGLGRDVKEESFDYTYSSHVNSFQFASVRATHCFQQWSGPSLFYRKDSANG